MAAVIFLYKDLKIETISIKKLAFLTALAVTIFLIENLIPKPLPFMKLGLANAIILYVIYTFGFKTAFIVGISKTILGALLAGTILSPTALMSLGGTFMALLMMLLSLKSPIPFSIIGISVIGAVTHNIMQLIIVRFVIIGDDGIFYLTPILIILGIVTGIITGYIAWSLRKSNILQGIK